jgi:hypothetical protein
LSVDQILGRHSRLEREFAHAHTTQPRSTALLARLAKDLAASQSAIVALEQVLA